MRSGHLNVEIGPFTGKGGDDWPAAVAWDELHEAGYTVHQFSEHPEAGADVVVWWSPEYHTPDPRLLRVEYPGYRVAFVGDWHINVPDLSGYDLIATDLRGVRTEFGTDTHVPLPPLLWYRGFSFDPRLHRDEKLPRIYDVGFMGRPAGAEREALLERVMVWCEREHRGYFMHTSTFHRGEEAAIYQQAKIVLGHSQRGELQMRAYEAMACGALYVCQHDTEEIHASGAPIPTYDPAMLPDFLEAWLADDKARAEMVARQQEWVQQETPQRHLRWLLDRVRERMPERASERNTDSGSPDDLDRREVPEAVRGAGSPVSGGGGAALRGAADPPLAPPVEPEEAKETRHAVVGLGGAADTAVGGTGGGVALGQVAAGDPPLEQQRRECVELVPTAATRILDWGCNEGGFGWALRQGRPDRIVVGLDSNERALAVAGYRLTSYGDPFDFDGAWPDAGWKMPGYWDCLTFLDVLEHLTLPGRLLRRARSLLKPDGCVVASIPNIRNLANLYALVARGEFRYFRAGRDEFRGPHDNVLSAGHIRLFTKESIAAMFTAAGYRIERWEQSRLSAPGMQRWHDDLAWLIECHGGDAEGWKRDEAHTIQHIISARPDWSVSVTADEGVL